jgi:hypothetical protein
MQEATIVERQQQVIDLLMKAVEPFAETAYPINAQDTSAFRGFFLVGDLRRAREAKVESEKILNSTSSTAL